MLLIVKPPTAEPRGVDIERLRALRTEHRRRDLRHEEIRKRSGTDNCELAQPRLPIQPRAAAESGRLSTTPLTPPRRRLACRVCEVAQPVDIGIERAEEHVIRARRQQRHAHLRRFAPLSEKALKFDLRTVRTEERRHNTDRPLIVEIRSVLDHPLGHQREVLTDRLEELDRIAGRDPPGSRPALEMGPTDSAAFASSLGGTPFRSCHPK